MAVWDDLIPEKEREIYRQAGFGRRAGFGQRPALMVIDVLYNFVGDTPKPIEESIQDWPHSCGEAGWDGVRHTRDLIETARDRRIPILYTLNESAEDRDDQFLKGMWRKKNRRAYEERDPDGRDGSEIVEEVAPRGKDIVFTKQKPSCFFGTPLMSYLNDLRVDTLILTGTTTCGCIRATAYDSFSYNFHTVIPEECVWDRGEVSHKAALFAIHQKYGDVIPKQEVRDYLQSTSTDLYPNFFDASPESEAASRTG